MDHLKKALVWELAGRPLLWLLSSYRRLANYSIGKVLEFARDSHSGPDDYTKPFWYRFGLEILIGIAITSFALITIGPTVSFQIQRWTSAKPLISIDAHRWKLLLKAQNVCTAPTEDVFCPSLLNDQLWLSQLALGDPGVSEILNGLMGKKFWIGVELSKDEVSRAFEAEASVFEIGVFNSRYRIFVNGILSEKGIGRDFLPTHLQIPLNLMQKGNSIRVLVEIDHNLKSRLPLWIPDNDEGIFSYDGVHAHTQSWIFHRSFRHLIMFSWSIMMSSIFCLLWLSVPKKTEYLFFGIYLLVFSLTGFINLGAITSGTNRPTLYLIDFWSVAAEGVLGCLLGLSYARIKRIYLLWVLGIGALIASTSYYSSRDFNDLYFYKDALLKFYVPAMFLLGSIFCFSQGLLLRLDRPKMINPHSCNIRGKRLLQFGTLLITVGMVFHLANSALLSTDPKYFHHVVQLVLLAFIGLVLFNEFRDRERHFELIVRSPFHDPSGKSGKEVFGFLVNMDLIGSSAIANYAAGLRTDRRPVTHWNSLIGRVMAQYGGFKVSDEGDGLKMFFEGQNTANGILKITEALTQAYRVTEKLEIEFKRNQYMLESHKLQFRSSVIWGGIKPIWKELVGVHSAEFEDANGMTTFKDSQRVMEVAKDINLNLHSKSVIIFSTHINLASLFPEYLFTRQLCKIRDVGEIELTFLELEFGLKTASHQEAV